MENIDLTYLTEFSGLGGSSLGLSQILVPGVNPRCVMALEYDPFDKKQNAYQHLVANFPDLYERGQILNKDIRDVSTQEVLDTIKLQTGQLSIFQTSFPCQSFSMANTKRSLEDEKNDFFYESLRHIEAVKPALVMGENVVGLSQGIMKSALYDMVQALRATGYELKVFKLNASDYGAPQLRPRLWILGKRADLVGEITIPKPVDKVVSLTDACPWLEATKLGQFSKAIIPGSKPCPTITKSQGLQVFQNGIPRKPTIEELRILSTFPPEFKFIGSDSAIHARLGNSVLPLAIQTLAEHLVKTLLIPNASLLSGAAEDEKPENFPLLAA